jgi:hypothetical protein
MRDTLKHLQTSVEEKISAEESTASHSSQKEYVTPNQFYVLIYVITDC